MNRAEIKAPFTLLSAIVLRGLAVLVPPGTNPLRVIHLDSRVATIRPIFSSHCRVRKRLEKRPQTSWKMRM
jgi:hypothetical protein